MQVALNNRCVKKHFSQSFCFHLHWHFISRWRFELIFWPWKHMRPVQTCLWLFLQFAFVSCEKAWAFCSYGLVHHASYKSLIYMKSTWRIRPFSPTCTGYADWPANSSGYCLCGLPGKGIEELDRLKEKGCNRGGEGWRRESRLKKNWTGNVIKMVKQTETVGEWKN